MSIMPKKFSQGFFFLVCFQIFAVFCFAQDLSISIEVPSENSSSINVKGNFSGEISEKNLLFLLSYADSDNLGARIENVELFDRTNQKINHRKIAEGSYVAEKPFDSFTYRITAAIPSNVLSTAHISWISGEKGILRLKDLLPEFETYYRSNVSVKLPQNWKLLTTESISSLNEFSVSSFQNAIFIVGKELKNQTFKVSGTTVTLILDEQWNIENSVAEQITKNILLKYENYFGSIPEKKLLISHFRFPKDVGFDRWRAEANGANIIIMSAPMTFESQLRQRIQEQLRHELFHLWMPNHLALEGDYAWFYEGFAQYTALRAGVELNQISFGDFLNTLEQAFNITNRRSQPISLIEASKNRWLGESSGVYSNGLTVAFLLDIALLKQSGGKRDLISVMRQIYEIHKKPNQTENGNAAVLKIFQNYPVLTPLIEDHVRGTKKPVFENYLTQTGIEVKRNKSNIELQIKDKLSGREKDLLNKLGYNNWRKILSK